MTELLELADVISRGGLVVVAILILVGGFKRWWVWGYQLEEMKSERDEYKGMLFRALNVAANALTATKGDSHPG